MNAQENPKHTLFEQEDYIFKFFKENSLCI